MNTCSPEQVGSYPSSAVVLRQPRWLAALFVAVFSASLLVSVSARADVITVRADEWFPLNGNPESPRPGFGIEILQEVWGKHGYYVDYQVAAWLRSLEMAHRGQIDCVIGAYVSDAPELVFPNTPLLMDEQRFYVRAGTDWHYQGAESLHGVSVGIIGGYSYGPELDKYFEEHREDLELVEMQGNDALVKLIRMMMSDRLDVIMESSFVMIAKLQEMGLNKQIKSAGAVEERFPAYVACSPERPEVHEYLRLYDEGVKALHRNGMLSDFYERYGLTGQEWGESLIFPDE